MSDKREVPYPGRGVALFLSVWGIGVAISSVVSAMLGQFPKSASLVVWLLALIASSLLSANAIRSRSTYLAVGFYCIWAIALVGGFIGAVYEPNRPQDLLGYAFAVIFVVALGAYLGRQLQR